MHKQFLLLILLCFVYELNAQQGFILNGYHNSGGNPDDYVKYIRSDKSGNFYVDGITYAPADLDPGTSVVSYSDPNNYEYIAKYGKRGNYLWSIYLHSDISKAYFVDDSANITIGGKVTTTIDMDPSTNVANIIPTSGIAGYITRYDSTGAHLWNVTISPTITNCFIEPKSIYVTTSGETIAFGLFKGSFDFDPSANTQILSSNPITGYATFFVKYSPIGNLVWCYVIANGSNSTDCNAIALDSQNNIFLGGSTSDNIDVGHSTTANDIVYTVGGQTAFIVKYDSNGQYIDSKSLLGCEGTLKYLFIDSNDDLFFTGTNIGNADMDLSANNYVLSHVNYKNYIGVYDNNFGFKYAWGYGFYNPGTFTFPCHMAIDSIGNIYAAVSGSSTNKIYKFSKSGSIIWQGNNGGSMGVGSLSYRNKTLFQGASFGGTKDVDPGSGYIGVTEPSNMGVDFYWIHVHDCQADSSSFSYEICQGDSLFAGGQYQLSTGTYYDTLVSSRNCDSVVITHLLVHPTYAIQSYDTICSGDSAWVFNQYQTTTGIYIDSSLTVYGCDSVNLFNLTVINVPIDVYYNMCPGDSIFAGGQFQFTSGIYSDTFSLPNSCDSIVNSHVSIGPIYVYDSLIICSNDSILIFGNYETTSGIYSDTSQTLSGCDSITSINLMIDSCTLVWPGDTDNDSLVTIYDFLPIGVYNGSNGINRDSISIFWIGHQSFNWHITQSNGNDIKYIDCNGDGIINLSDTIAVSTNLTQSHNFGSTGTRISTELYFSSTNTTISPNDTVIIDVIAGDPTNPVNSLYGIAFENSISNPSIIKPGSLHIKTINSFLGTIGNNFYDLKYIDGPNGNVGLAMTRFDQNSYSGFDTIAQLSFIIDPNISTTMQFEITFSNLNANDELGNNLDVNSDNTLVFNIQTPTSINDLKNENNIRVFPNPGSDNITLTSDFIMNFVSIYSTDGKLIQTINLNQTSAIINTSNIENGYYYLNIKSDNNSYTKNLIILR